MPEHAFRELYRRLDAELKRRKLIDFDDMMVLCYELLTARPDILDKCRSLFPYIMVDEFQDSNRIQYEIFRMLANPRQNACIVGDDDQSVYGFRGARPEIMQQFRKDFSSCEIVYLVFLRLILTVCICTIPGSFETAFNCFLYRVWFFSITCVAACTIR